MLKKEAKEKSKKGDEGNKNDGYMNTLATDALELHRRCRLSDNIPVGDCRHLAMN